jgi:hypothetical protein
MKPLLPDVETPFADEGYDDDVIKSRMVKYYLTYNILFFLLFP